MASTSFKMVGDIKELEKFLKAGTFTSDFNGIIRKATIRNSLFLIKKIKDNIRNNEFDSNSELTLALKNSDLPLLNQRNLWKAIDFKLQGSFISEIGVVTEKGSTGSQVGRAKSEVNIKTLVELMEEGYEITVTEKMKQAIAIALNKDQPRKKQKTRVAGGLKVGSTYTVPPRKVFTKVWEDPNIDKVLQLNWRKALEDLWKKRGAKNGEHRDR